MEEVLNRLTALQSSLANAREVLNKLSLDSARIDTRVAVAIAHLSDASTQADRIRDLIRVGQ